VKALVIIDMLDAFVDGALANPRAQAIVPPLKRILEHARREGWVVVFSNDAHQPGDPELKVWGEHAMAGSAGAQVISELQPQPGERELISPKRAYGAFDGTGLDEKLRALGVDEVVLAGQHTHLCASLLLWRADPRLRDHDPQRCRLRLRRCRRERGTRLSTEHLRRTHHQRRRSRPRQGGGPRRCLTGRRARSHRAAVAPRAQRLEGIHRRPPSDTEDPRRVRDPRGS
jgi:hypothetical protein